MASILKLSIDITLKLEEKPRIDQRIYQRKINLQCVLSSKIMLFTHKNPQKKPCNRTCGTKSAAK